MPSSADDPPSDSGWLCPECGADVPEQCLCPPSDIEPPSDSVRWSELLADCRAVGFDPVPIMIDELRSLGYTVTPRGLTDADITTEMLGDVDVD